MANNGTIDTLKTAINKRFGLAKPSRFYVEFTLPGKVGSASDMADLGLFCQSATMPTRTIETTDYATIRQGYKVPNGYSNEPITCTFLLGADYFPKTLFDKWISLTVDPVTYRIKYAADYCSDIRIYQLDDMLNRIYGVQLIDAFPTTLNPIELNMGNTDQVHLLNVTFAYHDVFILPKTGGAKIGPDDLQDKATNPIPGSK